MGVTAAGVIGTGVEGTIGVTAGVGTSVGTGVTAAGVIGTGVGVRAGFSGGPFFFWTRYHPAPPTITKAAIVIAMRSDLREDGRIGGVGIGGLSG